MQDVVIRITASGLCGSDLHLYLGQLPGMKKGDIMGHEPMGIGRSGYLSRAGSHGRRYARLFQQRSAPSDAAVRHPVQEMAASRLVLTTRAVSIRLVAADVALGLCTAA